MAKTTTLIDDIDMTPGAKTRYFAVGGIDYSIDLTEKNYERLLGALEPYRRVASVARKTRKQAREPLTPHERRQIRAWAAERGIQIADRGRFRNEVVDQFLKEREAYLEEAQALEIGG